MPLPPITNLDPEVVPAVDARNYDSMYMVGLFTRLLDTSVQNMRLHFRPYDSAANVVKPDDEVVVTIDDMFVKAAECPSFAEALGAVILVGNLFVQEQQLVTRLAEMEDDDEGREAVQAELDAVQATMATSTLADLSA